MVDVSSSLSPCLRSSNGTLTGNFLLIQAGFISESGNTELDEPVSHQGVVVSGSSAHQQLLEAQLQFTVHPADGPLPVRVRQRHAVAGGNTMCVKEAVLPACTGWRQKGQFSQVQRRNGVQSVALRLVRAVGQLV